MRKEKNKLSEFGAPRGSTAWRARGPPMTVLRPGRSIGNSFTALLLLKQLNLHGAFFLKPFPLLAIVWVLLHRVICYCIFVPHDLMTSQEPVPLRYHIPGVGLAHKMTSGVRVHGYPCVPLYYPMGAYYVSQWPAGLNGKRLGK